MKRIHVVGRKNHGKTTLIVDLVRELSRRGLRVGTVKHSSHVHELDAPGKDSFLQRQAGADPAAIVTADSIGVYLSRGADTDFYGRLAGLFAGCDLVLVEGHIDCDGVKIEVWRREVGGTCLARERHGIKMVVSDDEPDVDLPVCPRRDVAQLAEHILAIAKSES